MRTNRRLADRYGTGVQVLALSVEGADLPRPEANSLCVMLEQ